MRSLTILILTYNRYPRLLRLLNYVASVRLPYEIHLLDSSSDPLPPGPLQGFLGNPGIRYRKFGSTLPPIAKVSEGLSQVRSPYVVVWADDDFLVPRSLEEGIRFLEEHPDYSVVHGESGLFRLGSGNAISEIRWIEPYPQRSLDDPAASERLMTHLSRSYSVVFYSIHRTGNLKRNMDLCRELEFSYGWGELLSGSLSVVQGKTKKLDRLYMLREVHSGMDTWNLTGKKFSRLSWITEPDFSSKYQQFHHALSGELARQDRIGLEEAEDLVKQAFWLYLANAVLKGWGRRSGRGQAAFGRRLRQAAQDFPILRGAWLRVRRFIPGMEPELSLQALRRSTDRHHADFERIEEAVTRG